MLLPNPNKHYPLYQATVMRLDGRMGTMTGSGEEEMVYIKGEEEEIYGVEVVGVAHDGQCSSPTLWIMGSFCPEYDPLWAKWKPEEEPEEEPEEGTDMPYDPPECSDNDSYHDWENEVNE